MSSPLVSIITPTYNSSDFLKEAIISVKNQTYPYWEMLIIDDGSTDNTPQIVNGFAKNDARINYLSLSCHTAKASAPRNYGMKQAKGDYIAFLDADDIWLPEKLERQIRFMEENKDIFLVYAKCFVKKNNIRTIFPKEECKKGNIFKSLFLSHNFIPCLTVMMRNKAKENIYFFDEDIRLKAIEDFDLWLAIAQNEKIGFINSPLAIYRVHPKNTSIGLTTFFKRYKRIIKKHRLSISKITLFRKYLLFYIFFLKLFLINVLSNFKKTINRVF